MAARINQQILDGLRPVRIRDQLEEGWSIGRLAFGRASHHGAALFPDEADSLLSKRVSFEDEDMQANARNLKLGEHLLSRNDTDAVPVYITERDRSMTTLPLRDEYRVGVTPQSRARFKQVEIGGVSQRDSASERRPTRAETTRPSNRCVRPVSLSGPRIVDSA